MLVVNRKYLSIEYILFTAVWLMTALGLNVSYLKEGLQIVLLLYLLLIHGTRLPDNTTLLTRILFTLWCGMSIMWATYTSVSVNRTISVIQTLILLYEAMLFVDEDEKFDYVLKLMVLTAFIYMVSLFTAYPIVQLLMGTVDISERATAFGINGNIVGIFLVYAGLILLDRLPRTRFKIPSAILAVVFIAFSFLTGSKKAFFTCLLGIFLLFVLRSSNYGKIIRNTIIGAAVVLLIVYASMNIDVLYEVVGYRIESFYNYMIGDSTFNDDKSTWGRGYLIQWAREMFMAHPILGCGIGNFQYLNELGKYAHNNYWELLANLGIVGFILYYIPFLRYLVVCLRERFRYADLRYNFVLTMIALILMIDYANMTYTNEIFTLLIGALFAETNLLRSNPVENKYSASYYGNPEF